LVLSKRKDSIANEQLLIEIEFRKAELDRYQQDTILTMTEKKDSFTKTELTKTQGGLNESLTL
jgi:hypothetical protein